MSRQESLSPTPATHDDSSSEASTAVAGAVRTALRAEGLAELAIALTLYVHGGYSGWLFAALILLPDLSLLARRRA